MIKSYEIFINERNLISDFKKSFHKQQFRVGDICIYNSGENRELDGHKCLIMNVELRRGRSVFKFTRPKKYYYKIEFIDVYNDMIYGNPGDLNSVRLKKQPLIKYFVKEEDLEFDSESTTEYREKQENYRKMIGIHDLYGEDDWRPEEDKVLYYKWDVKKRNWVKESHMNELDPYNEEDWNEEERKKEDIYFTQDILGQVSLYFDEKYLSDHNEIDDKVYDYIRNYFLDFDEKRFEHITKENPIHFILLPELDDEVSGFLEADNGKLKIIQWG